MSNAEPSWNKLPALSPSEDPRDSAQAVEAHPPAAPRGPRTDFRVLQLRDRSREFVVLQHLGIINDIRAIETEGRVGKLIQRSFPLGQKHAGLMAVRIACIGARKGI